MLWISGRRPETLSYGLLGAQVNDLLARRDGVNGSLRVRLLGDVGISLDVLTLRVFVHGKDEKLRAVASPQLEFSNHP